MSLKQEWVEYCLGLSGEPADLYSGCRKILRGRVMIFTRLDDSLQLADAGFTKHKMRYLERAYLHADSLAVAIQLWERRRKQDKYGSVGVTCYSHLVKGSTASGTDALADVEGKKSKRASVMGPCIQAFTVTYLDKRRYAIDVFYRTTELLKKFPADLVFLRDVLLKDFDVSGMHLEEVRCHFANVTVHPMYFATILPLLDDPVGAMQSVLTRDKYFHDWLVKWSARYTCDEFHRGIAKFAQALRVHKDMHERLTPEKLAAIQTYIRANHPPFTRCRFDEVPAALRGKDPDQVADASVEDDDEDGGDE